MFKIVEPIKFCMDCKYFSAPPKPRSLKHGECTKFAKLNKVDGSIEFTMASVAREYDCKDRFYEPKDDVQGVPK